MEFINSIIYIRREIQGNTLLYSFHLPHGAWDIFRIGVGVHVELREQGTSAIVGCWAGVTNPV